MAARIMRLLDRARAAVTQIAERGPQRDSAQSNRWDEPGRCRFFASYLRHTVQSDVCRESAGACLR